MGPTWGPSGAARSQVGPMFAPWTLLSGMSCVYPLIFTLRPLRMAGAYTPSFESGVKGLLIPLILIFDRREAKTVSSSPQLLNTISLRDFAMRIIGHWEWLQFTTPLVKSYQHPVLFQSFIQWLYRTHATGICFVDRFDPNFKSAWLLGTNELKWWFPNWYVQHTP